MISEIDIFPTCDPFLHFQKSMAPTQNIRQNSPGSHAHVWDPAPQILAANRKPCHHFLPCRKTCPGPRPFRKTWPSLAELAETIFARKPYWKHRFLGSEWLYRTTAHIHMSMNWRTWYGACDYSTQVFVSAVCLSVCNSISNGSQSSMPELCICIIRSSQSFKLSNLLQMRSFPGPNPTPWTLSIQPLWIQQKTQFQRRCQTWEIHYCTVPTYQLWVCSTHSKANQAKPCLLGLRHLFIRYLLQRGQVT